MSLGASTEPHVIDQSLALSLPVVLLLAPNTRRRLQKEPCEYEKQALDLVYFMDLVTLHTLKLLLL